jgi:hypothetical protein|tara:strand:+ start:1815 stop:1985 length:171 start_codon:yes stop_codon:yes gene_type:complete
MSIQHEQALDEIRTNIQDALELAREQDEPRDMEMRFILSLLIEKVESLRYEIFSEI